MNRQPVKQFRMRWLFALDAEVFRGLDQPSAEKMLPISVDGHACGQRMIPTDQPAPARGDWPVRRRAAVQSTGERLMKPLRVFRCTGRVRGHVPFAVPFDLP